MYQGKCLMSVCNYLYTAFQKGSGKLKEELTCSCVLPLASVSSWQWYWHATRLKLHPQTGQPLISVPWKSNGFREGSQLCCHKHIRQERTGIWKHETVTSRQTNHHKSDSSLSFIWYAVEGHQSNFHQYSMRA